MRTLTNPQLAKWHKGFAWLPMMTHDFFWWVWMEPVEYRMTPGPFGNPQVDVRIPSAS